MEENFSKKRKNLMLVSLALLFVETSGISFNKINILGNEATIKNEYIIIYSIWVAYIYVFIRYCQDLYDHKNREIISKIYEFLSDCFQRRKNEIFASELIEFSEEFSSMPSHANDDIYRCNVTYVNLTMPLNLSGLFNITTGCGCDIYFKNRDSKFITKNSSDFVKNFSRPESIMYSVDATMKTLIKTSLGTEYFFPFFIFSLPIVYKLAIRLVG